MARIQRARRVVRRRYGGVKTRRNWQITRFGRYQAAVPSLKYQIASGVHLFKRSMNAINDSTNCTVDGTTCVRDTGNYSFYLRNALGSGAGTKLYGTMTYQFSIEGLPNLTEFTNLFDAYRINKIVMKITPRATSVDVSSPGTSFYQEGPSPILHYVIDNDDVTTPSADQSGIDVLRQFATYKQVRLTGNRPFKVVIKPRPVSTVYGYSTGLLINPRKQGAWMNCANTNIKHYGFKSILEYLAPSANTSWRYNFEVDTTYYMSFKGVR